MFEPRAAREQRAVLVSDCGRRVELDIERFRATPSRAERRFLKRLTGPILDIGCGPGRAAAYLRQRDIPALGLDVNADLVALARSNGALCVHQCTFDPVPFEGRWQEVLLLDGNVGIGGDPAKLIERLRCIVAPGGRALIEVESSGTSQQMIVREHVNGRVGEPFAWATLTLGGLDALISGSGWRCVHVHQIDDRLVVELERME